jgi:protein-S-isoprenylcysteine O-methyltransferase Ste14
VVNESTGWALVGAQFGVLGALIVLPAGDLWSRQAVSISIAAILILAGLWLVAAGGFRLGRSLTPLPIPKEDGVLVTTGIYRFVRHPIYSGVLLAGLGLVAWGASLAHVVGWVSLWLILNLKAALEEKLLKERYGEYESYSLKTGRLLPKLFTR